NGWKVESGRIRDRLQEIRICCVRIGPGNRRMLVYAQRRDSLRKDVVWIKIRVVAVVAVARPPTGINCELGQVGEPMSDQVWVHSGRSAAHQSAKWVEICGRRSMGD